MSEPFYLPPAGQPTFHGRVSTERADKGFDNYFNLTAAHYCIRIFLNGEEQRAVTADPAAGIIETFQGDQVVILTGHVEIKLERRKP